METRTEPLPRWDMASILPRPGSDEFAAAFAAAVRGIADLGALFDAHGVGRCEPAPLDEATVRAVEEVVGRYNAAFAAARDLETYLDCVVAADVDDAAAKAALSEVRQHGVRLAQLEARFVAWVGSLDVEALIERSAVARDHAFALRRARRAAAHLMSPAEEELAAELSKAGAVAWYRLRQDIEAGLTASVELDGEVRTLPISEVVNLAFRPERGVRQRAHEADRTAWGAAAVPLAAALNGVKGETVTLCDRRGWTDPLDAALVANRIDRPTLDAMLAAIREAYPDLRRYLRAKARALGLPLLAGYDRWAPVGDDARSWPFWEAADFVVEQFAGYSPKLGAFAARALRERWIDAEPRAGKEGGGFCAGLGGGVARILLNYAPSFVWMSALAHELGHAYHNAVLHEFGRTLLQRSPPMPPTLAETASTFCETLVQRAALRQASDGSGLGILDGVLQGITGNVFSTTHEFAFERELFAARRRRELSIGELTELALAAQREVLGDAVDPATLSPFSWAVAPHGFMVERWYYNFPYAFGLLFGLGLYARYEADPETFRTGFDELLAATGMAETAELASGFGIDVRTPDFWRGSLDVVRSDIERFEGLVAEQTTPAAAI